MSAVDSGLDSGNSWYQGVFRRYGGFAFRNGKVLASVGIIVLIGLSMGLLDAEEETAINELWVEKGTRLREERANFRLRFGVGTRLQLVSQSAKDGKGGNSVTKAGLAELVNVLKPMLTEGDANSLSVSYKFTGMSAATTFTQAQMCDAPPVPSAFTYGLAPLSNTPAVVQRGNFGSWGWAHATDCAVEGINASTNTYGTLAQIPLKALVMKDFALLNYFPPSYKYVPGKFPDTTGSVAGTPASFGVTRFPCTRATVLDCFKEGNFDYPTELQVVDGFGLVALTFSGLSSAAALRAGAVASIAADAGFQGAHGNNATLYNAAAAQVVSDAEGIFSTCIATSKATMGGTIDAIDGAGQLPPGITAAFLKATANSFIDNAFVFFGGVGYQWRRSYVDLADDAAVVDHVVNSVAFQAPSAVDAATCLGSTLQGGNSCCLLWSGTKLPDNLWLGAGSKTFANGGIPAHRVGINNFGQGSLIWENNLVTNYGLSAAPSRDEQEELAIQFERKWIDYIKPIWEGEQKCPSSTTLNAVDCVTKIDFLFDDSVDDIIKDASKPEAILVITGYLVLIIYTALALCRFPCVYSRAGLGLMGIFVVALSTVAGFGLTAFFEKLNPLSTNLVPFLSLGIGVDDMYVLIQTLVLQAVDSSDPEKRMEETMAVAGPSVFLTSLTNTCAFFVAALTPIPAVTQFVIQMALTVVTNFLSLMIIFVPMMAFDAQRVADKKNDIFCCGAASEAEEEENYVSSTSGPINTCTSKALIPCMRSVVGKIVILFVFSAIFVILAVLAFTEVKNGFQISDIALRGSYQRDFVTIQETYFGGYSNSLISLNGDQDWETTSSSNPADALNCDDSSCKSFVFKQMLDSLEASDLTQGVLDLTWLLTGSTTLNGFRASSIAPPAGFNAANWADSSYGTPPAAFRSVFSAWAGTVGATSLSNLACRDWSTDTLVVCTKYEATNDVKLDAAASSIYTKNLLDDDDFIAVIKDGRKRVDAIDPNNSYMYGYVYQYWDQYVNIETNLYKIVGWALLGCFLATLIFQFSPITSILVTLVILKVIIEVYGFIYVLGIKLNAFSLVNLTMSVGLAVEFTAHVSHVFLMAKGTKNDRMASAVMEMMAPMANGFASSFLAVVALGFAKFPFFRDYYFGMFGFMIAMSFLDGMIFLPVVLSLIGPAEFSTAHTPKSGMAMQKLGSRAAVSTETTDV